ncbi:hypothetical protein SCA6_017087 [Theobroma cacao]
MGRAFWEIKSTNQKEIHVETLCKSMEPNVVPALRKQNSWPHLQPLYKQPQAQNQASKGKPSSPKTLPSLIYFSYFKGKKKREISIFIYPSISASRCCCSQQSFKLKCVNAIPYLGSIGLLGEYCPSVRKKIRPLSDKFGCMHLGPFQEHPDFHGCSWLQPFVIAEDQSALIPYKIFEDFTAANTLSSSICCL